MIKGLKISVLKLLRQKIWNLKTRKTEFLEVMQNFVLVENFCIYV